MDLNSSTFYLLYSLTYIMEPSIFYLLLGKIHFMVLKFN